MGACDDRIVKRDPSLIPLSHQHHNGLALVVMVSRSLATDASEANLTVQAARIVDRFEIELVNHFVLEEELLFPAVPEHPLVAELIAEHRQMEAMVGELRDAPARATVEAFLELLRAHIRREENDLFQEAQEKIPREQLDAIGAEVDRRAVRVCL